MALPGLVAARNLADVADRERAWDSLGAALSASFPIPANFEAEAIQYIAAVEEADGQALELPVRLVINDFVAGCKQDGIWSAIKACCILAGARTLNGSLVPLIGAAPTSFNFVNGDYNRKTGLLGDGGTKYLDSNSLPSVSDLNNTHLSVYSVDTSTNRGYIGSPFVDGGRHVAISAAGITFALRLHSGSTFPALTGIPADIVRLFGYSRNNNSSIDVRFRGISSTYTSASTFVNTTSTDKVFLARDAYLASRLAFYSIGESLDLALLDARVTTLINAIGAAIP
jgi:hypothetical protein